MNDSSRILDKLWGKMKIGNCDEVYYWENPISPGYTIYVYSYKPMKTLFPFFSDTSPSRSIEETENERDEDPDFYPDEINGEAVKRELGEYYIGYDFDPFQIQKQTIMLPLMNLMNHQ